MNLMNKINLIEIQKENNKKNKLMNNKKMKIMKMSKIK